MYVWNLFNKVVFNFRILAFLAKPEAMGTSIALDTSTQNDEDEKLVKEDEDNPENIPEDTFNLKRKHILKFSNASFSWQKGGTPVLHNLNLTIPNGSLTIIYGKVNNFPITRVLSISILRTIWQW